MKIISLLALGLLQVLSMFTYADNAFDIRENVSGLWADVNTEAFENGYMVIAQDGEAIHVAHYVEWNGKPLVEYGSGKREGDTIRYKVAVTRTIPGWATSGIHTLTLSEDGNRLKGTYKTPDGGTGPLVFERAGK